MAKTVLITGASSGIGRATALYFHEKGWQVIATMRSPGKENGFPDGIDLVKLDVTDKKSIDSAISYTTKKYGKLDVLINNTGYATEGPTEDLSSEQIKKIFDTNVLGLLEVTKAVIPIMRGQKSGTIVNVSSVGGRWSFRFILSITAPNGLLRVCRKGFIRNSSLLASESKLSSRE